MDAEIPRVMSVGDYCVVHANSYVVVWSSFSSPLDGPLRRLRRANKAALLAEVVSCGSCFFVFVIPSGSNFLEMKIQLMLLVYEN